MKRANKGFTLIELLVVIAIIGLLAGVVFASLNTARQKARDARRVADLKQIQLALELYFDDNRFYAVALGDLDPTYIPQVPTDPLSATQNYAYARCGTGNTDYTLAADLEDNGHAVLRGDVDTATCSLIGQTPADCADAGGAYCVEP